MSGLKDVKRRWGDAFAQVHWADVERLLADHYRAEGYRVEHCGTGGSGSRFDGGIDLKLYRDDQYLVVQCKHWNIKQVPHNDVHQLIGVMVTERATGAILVTSGEFTYAALKAAAKHDDIRLIDGESLREMLGRALPEPAPAAERWQPVASAMIELAADVLDAPRSRRRRRPVMEALWLMIAVKLLAPVLLFAGFMWWLNGAVADFGAKAGAVRVMPPSPQGSAVTASPPTAVAPPPVSAQQRAIDVAESQRRSEEAIRVLEPNTAEIGHFPTPAEIEQARQRNSLAPESPR